VRPPGASAGGPVAREGADARGNISRASGAGSRGYARGCLFSHARGRRRVRSRGSGGAREPLGGRAGARVEFVSALSPIREVGGWATAEASGRVVFHTQHVRARVSW
jgi:hypothetical protein